MIKTVVVSTVEDVDINFAIDELTSKIKSKEPLLRNSVGLLFCNMEFIKSGLVTALCKRLPFEVIGCTSQIFAVQNVGEEFMLTLMILTSDDVEFTAGLSEPLDSIEESGLEDFYRDLSSRGSNPQKPALMLVCAPPLTGLPTNRQVDMLDHASGGVPMFGTIALDIAAAIRTPMTIFNGNSYTNRIAVILLRGDVHPRFISHSLPGEPHLQQKFTITEARENKIYSINNMPAGDYFKKLGLVGQNRDEMQVIYAFPIIMDGGGEPPKSIIISLMDEEGALVSEQDIPPGTTAVVGTVSREMVLASTRFVLRQLEEAADAGGIILISCFNRVLTLQDTLEEVNLVIKQLRDPPAPFVFLSSGGEICPVPGDKQDELKNKFHQSTIIACIL
jgi:hypothetical protein